MLKRLLILTVLLMLVPIAAQAAWLDPDFRFRTIRTEHFDVHFHQGLEPFAEKAAAYAEEAYCSLGEAFGWRPLERTHLVLVDSSDLANGFTTVLPYNMVFVYMVPPLPDMSIGEYDDWLRMVVFHEYAHVATMDAVRGYSAFMRKIFGKSIPGYDPLSVVMFFLSVPPNVLMPDWWLEGMATWTETAYTTRGRGRSAYYEMIFRKAVEEDAFLHISRLNGDIPYWPGGSTPYIYGLGMMRHITRNYGADTMKALNMGSAGRFPYAISGPPKRATGKHYVQLYSDMVDELYREQSGKLADLMAIPLTPFETLEIEGERLYYPRLSPDGKLLAVERHDPHGHGGIAVLDAETLEERDFIHRLPSGMALTWGPDSNTLCYTQADLRGGYNLYQDLYCYDVEDEDADRITKNQRIKDPAYSPDGRTIAVVSISPTGQALALLDTNVKRPKPLVLSEFPGMRVSSPRWDTEGRRIAYSVRDSAGNTGLRIHDTTSGEDEGVYVSDKGADFPVWSPDGRHIIFTSYQTGVFNIFALRVEDRTLFQVTNITGGAFYPEVTPDGHILFSSYHAKGLDIARMDYRPLEWSTAIGPVIEPYWPEELVMEPATCEEGAPGGAVIASGDTGTPADTEVVEEIKEDIATEGALSIEENVIIEDVEAEGVTPETSGEIEITETAAVSNEEPSAEKPAATRPRIPSIDEATDYNAFRSFWPRFWLPTIRVDHVGGAVGAFTAAQDVLGYHTFIGDVGIGASDHGYYDLAYMYNRWYPVFTAYAYARPVMYFELGVDDEDLWQKQSGAVGMLSFAFRRLETWAVLHLGYRFQKDRPLYDPDEILFEGRRDSSFAALEFTNALRYPYSVSREEGRTLMLEYRDHNRDRNSDFNASEYWLSWEEYIGLPGHHVLYFRAKGAAYKGEDLYTPYFYIGGGPGENPDFSVRGFPSGYRTGDYVATVTLEHRFPIWYLLRGPNTKPLFFDRMHIAGFIDAGAAWTDEDEPGEEDIDAGIGSEIRFDMVLGYKFKITPAVGIAYGMDKEKGETQVYITVYAPF